MMRRTLVAALAAASVLSAACSSTTDKSGNAAGSGSEALESGAGTGGAASAGPGASAAATKPGSGKAGTTGGAGTTSGAGGTSAGGATGGSGGASTGAAGGATGGGPLNKSEIKIGYAVIDTTGFSALTGASDPTTSDQNAGENSSRGHQEFQALVKYANDTGGVGGRKIVAKGYDVPVTSNNDERTRVCVTATEDAKVKVFIDQSIMLGQDQWNCFAQHKVSFVGLLQGTDQRGMAPLKPYVATTFAGTDRQATAVVSGLNSLGYFKGAKVGVALTDTPSNDRMFKQTLVPALNRIGIKSVESVKLSPPYSAQVGSQAANGVFRFKNAGVNRVIMFVGLLEYLAFTKQATSQDFHPNYAFPDYQGIAGLARIYGDDDSNKDSYAVSSDLVATSDTAKPEPDDAPIDRKSLPPGAQKCLDVYSKYLKVNYYDSPSKSGISAAALYFCDHFFAWLASARQAGAAWTPGDLIPGLTSLGRGYQPTRVHADDFSGGRMDGASDYRIGKWNTDCACFAAITPWRGFP
ncbi:MAG: hypothetical protein QOE05_312 [Actinomycetota bacterium]|jgi:hypothetical protein|nr:hypothetical protein [Actinomycetota bacterium]